MALFGIVRTMIIGILSDTHDAHSVLPTVMRVFEIHKAERIIHCGDWKSPTTARYLFEQAAELNIPLQGVLGNNDQAIQEFLALGLQVGVLVQTCDGRRIAAYHGHHKPTLNKLLQNVDDNDVLFLGHSHKPRDERLDGLHIVNPGSTAFSIPRSKTWQPTIAIYDTETDQAEIITVA